MTRQRIVVTGGCGFIGSHLAERLAADGNAVTVLDNLSTGRRQHLSSDARLIEADILDAARLGEALDGVDFCFHLAAVASVERSVQEWRSANLVNLAGSVAVFEACAARGVPVAYASSAAVYGVPREVPLSEDAPTAPQSPYGADKLAMEFHARAGGQCRGLASVGLRLFNVYGARQDPASPYSGVISRFADRARRGEDIEIHGDGAQTRDFIHVEDVVDAFCRAAHNASTEAPVFNVATGAETSVAELGDLVVRLTGSQSRLTRAPARPGDIPRSCGDAGALTRATGWSPTIGIGDGLAALLRDAR